MTISIPRTLDQKEIDTWRQSVVDEVDSVVDETDAINLRVDTAQVTANTGVSNASTAQSTANTAISNAANAQSSANTANSAIANIVSDSILSPSEKPMVVQDYSVITTEQTGIDAQATAYGITTEKTTYDNAVGALTTYLGTLTGWNTVPGSDVAIVGTTFRAAFALVYTTRQALLNKIAEVAGTKAAWTGLSNIPATLAAPDGAGLYLSSTNLGYYNGSVWKVYIDSSGNLILGGVTGSDKGISWNQGTGVLLIRGTLVADDIASGTLNADRVNAGSLYFTKIATADGNRITPLGTGTCASQACTRGTTYYVSATGAQAAGGTTDNVIVNVKASLRHCEGGMGHTAQWALTIQRGVDGSYVDIYTPKNVSGYAVSSETAVLADALVLDVPGAAADAALTYRLKVSWVDYDANGEPYTAQYHTADIDSVSTNFILFRR